MLFIVSTPIGNLEDITLRAIRTLREADIIAAEDTRHSKILLDKFEIQKPTVSFHAWSDERKLNELISLLLQGKNIALISDAGTPGISDPGYVLIKAAIDEKIPVIPIPGPSAFLTALSASGLPIHQFLYLGFLPVKKGRQTLLKTFKEETRTLVFYESPHRILKTLSELAGMFPDRPFVIARELTKIHEEFFRGTTAEAANYFRNKQPKGEFVLILGPEKRASNHGSEPEEEAEDR